MAKMQKKMRKNVNRTSQNGLLGDQPMPAPQAQGSPQTIGSADGPQNTSQDKLGEQIQTLTAMSMSVIYDEKVGVEKNLLPDAFKRAVKTVAHPEDAGPLAIADVSLWVIEEIEKKAETKKKMIPPEIAAGAIGSIVAQVAEVAQIAGVKLSEEDIQVGIAVAINKYISTAQKEGRINNQELIETAKTLQEKYPEELQDFNQMIQNRTQRHKADIEEKTAAQQAPQQPVAQQGAGPPQGLLQARPVQGGV